MNKKVLIALYILLAFAILKTFADFAAHPEIIPVSLNLLAFAVAGFWIGRSVSK